MKHVARFVNGNDALPHSVKSHTHNRLGRDVALFEHRVGHVANAFPIIGGILLSDAAICRIERIRNRSGKSNLALGRDKNALDAACSKIVCQNVFFHTVIPRIH